MKLLSWKNKEHQKKKKKGNKEKVSQTFRYWTFITSLRLIDFIRPWEAFKYCHGKKNQNQNLGLREKKYDFFFFDSSDKHKKATAPFELRLCVIVLVELPRKTLLHDIVTRASKQTLLVLAVTKYTELFRPASFSSNTFSSPQTQLASTHCTWLRLLSSRRQAAGICSVLTSGKPDCYLFIFLT